MTNINNTILRWTRAVSLFLFKETFNIMLKTTSCIYQCIQNYCQNIHSFVHKMNLTLVLLNRNIPFLKTLGRSNLIRIHTVFHSSYKLTGYKGGYKEEGGAYYKLGRRKVQFGRSKVQIRKEKSTIRKEYCTN